MYLVPPLGNEVFLRPFELVLGCSNYVASAFFGKQLEIVLTGHAAVHDPDPVAVAVERFHFVNDDLHRLRVVPVPLEDLVAKRDPPLGDDHADTDLLAVRTPVAGVAPLGLRVFRLPPSK